LDTSASTVHRVRQAWVDQGLEAALSRQSPTGRQDRQLAGCDAVRRRLQRVGRGSGPGRPTWAIRHDLLHRDMAVGRGDRVNHQVVMGINPLNFRTTERRAVGVRHRDIELPAHPQPRAFITGDRVRFQHHAG
jgi:hypothetical protein